MVWLRYISTFRSKESEQFITHISILRPYENNLSTDLIQSPQVIPIRLPSRKQGRKPLKRLLISTPTLQHQLASTDPSHPTSKTTNTTNHVFRFQQARSKLPTRLSTRSQPRHGQQPRQQRWRLHVQIDGRRPRTPSNSTGNDD